MIRRDGTCSVAYREVSLDPRHSTTSSSANVSEPAMKADQHRMRQPASFSAIRWARCVCALVSMSSVS